MLVGMEGVPLSLFETALEYASRRAPGWGPMLICQRADGGYGYRVALHRPVISVPAAPADSHSLSLLAWLFGRHNIWVHSLASANPREEAWKEAEDIFPDLCLLAGQAPDTAAFELERALVMAPVA
jgi:hypothetical protein